MLAPPQNLCFDIAMREIRRTQKKHARAILSVEKQSSDGSTGKLDIWEKL